MHSDVSYHFAYRKIYQVFSMIAVDQPHNQNTAVIKAYRGTFGLTEDRYKAFFSLPHPILPNPIRRTSEGYFGYQVINGVSLVGRMSLYSAKRIILVKR